MSLPQHRDTQETLAVLDRLDLDTDKPTEEETAKKYLVTDLFISRKVSHLCPLATTWQVWI